MTYSATVQSTGIKICFNGEQVGGWNVKQRHLYILGTFAEADVDRLRAFERELKGIEPTPRPNGTSYYWELPESRLETFREAVEAATGKRMQLG